MAEPAQTRVTIRPATPGDAGAIVRPYLDSAVQHADLDPERYFVPAADAVVARYQEGRQHPPASEAESVTLVAELGGEGEGEIVGFVDARIDRSPDAMHREMSYCHIIEIAVSAAHQNQGIGARLLRAAEDWGRARGAAFASLEYLAANTRAAAFYERRMGYRAGAVTAIKRL